MVCPASGLGSQICLEEDLPPLFVFRLLAVIERNAMAYRRRRRVMRRRRVVRVRRIGYRM